MKINQLLVQTMLGCAAALMGTSSLAQMSPATSEAPLPNTVMGRNLQVVKCKPTTVRVYLQVSAKAKTLDAALDNFKKRCDAIRAQVAKLGGNADTIKFTALDKADSSQQQQMMETMRRQMGGERVPKGLTAPQSVSVNATFAADWPLAGDSPEKLLLETEQLKKKLVDADLAGAKAAEAEQTPEEKEMAEEMQAMLRDRNNGEQPKVGEPILMFVARLPDAKRDAALEAAFKQAQTHAERLAKAAGMSLGKLVRLNEVADVSFADLINRQRMEMYSPTGYPDSQQPWQPQVDADENEATSRRPEELEFRVGVEAAFSLNEKISR